MTTYQQILSFFLHILYSRFRVLAQERTDFTGVTAMLTAELYFSTKGLILGFELPTRLDNLLACLSLMLLQKLLGESLLLYLFELYSDDDVWVL